MGGWRRELWRYVAVDEQLGEVFGLTPSAA